MDCAALFGFFWAGVNSWFFWTVVENLLSARNDGLWVIHQWQESRLWLSMVVNVAKRENCLHVLLMIVHR